MFDLYHSLVAVPLVNRDPPDVSAAPLDHDVPQMIAERSVSRRHAERPSRLRTGDLEREQRPQRRQITVENRPQRDGQNLQDRVFGDIETGLAFVRGNVNDLFVTNLERFGFRRRHRLDQHTVLQAHDAFGDERLT